MKNKYFTLITFTLLALVIYNILYWASKLPETFQTFHKGVVAHWKLITFLEFLAMASVAVDIIVRWDGFGLVEKRVRVILTAFLSIMFMFKLITGVIEMYMRGGVS